MTPVRADTAAAGLTWLMSTQVLHEMAASSSALATMQLGHIDELVGSGDQPSGLGAADARSVMTFTGEAALAAWLRGQQAKPGELVLYDPEAWARTPLTDQRHLASAIAAAGSAARLSHVTLLVSPALDLAAALETGTRRWNAYISLGIAADVARAGAILVVQAQSLERDPMEYGRFVAQAARQADSARRGTIVLAGISTNPTGPLVTIGELEASVTASLPVTKGYWLNVPSPGPACPGCHEPDASLGRELILWLGHRPARHLGS